jgi:spermidine synthase
VVELFAFFAGAILMSLEILGSRVLAPQYGSSVVVWASLIGVFMGALATGYWLGGALADRWPKRAGVGIVLATSGMLVTLIPVAAPFVFAIAGDSLRRGSLVAAVGLFYLPTSLMGAVSPYAIRLQEVAAGHLGRTAGRLYAISTIGSILGTVVTAFWLIPLAGVAMLIVALGVALLLLASVTFASGVSETAASRAMAIASFAVAIVLASAIAATGQASVARALFGERLGERLLAEKDSLYHHIIVSDDGGVRWLRFDHQVQTAMPLNDRLGTAVDYPDYFHLARIIRPQIRSVLLIGLGGATTPKQFLAAYPDVSMDAVDLDADVVKMARQYFFLPAESDRFHIFIEDGRNYLAAHQKKYDLIIVDAYHVDSIPFHLFTRQFFELAQSRLNANGLIAMNIISALDGENSGVASSIYRTAGLVFPERYLFPIRFHSAHSRTMRHNICFIVGEGVTLREEELRAAAMRSNLPAYARRVIDFEPRPPDMRTSRILSDDYAPVDDLLHVQ